MFRLYEELGERMSILGIHPPGHPSRVINGFIKHHDREIPYMLAVDDKSELMSGHNVTILPTTVLVNTRGDVLSAHVGYSQDQEKEIENAIRSKLPSG